MKQFITYISLILIVIVALLYALDSLYNSIYINSKARNKVSFAIQNNKEVFDVVILGSSRANNHFETEQFIEKNLYTYNFGMNGASLEESALLLDILLENNTIKNVIVEVDLNISNNFFSDGTRVRFLPYINKSETIKSYYKTRFLDFNKFKNLPFYKYIKYDYRIGFRETFFYTY